VATFAVADSAMLIPAHAHRRERVGQVTGGDQHGFRFTKIPVPRIPGTVSIRLQSHGEILRRAGPRGCCSCQLIELLRASYSIARTIRIYLAVGRSGARCAKCRLPAGTRFSKRDRPSATRLPSCTLRAITVPTRALTPSLNALTKLSRPTPHCKCIEPDTAARQQTAKSQPPPRMGSPDQASRTSAARSVSSFG